MNIAIFGGTFDPIHKAHLAVAHVAAESFQLDKILLTPAARPPHKAGVTHASYEARVRMAELACAGDPRIEVSRLEEGTYRSFSIGTIQKVRAGMSAGDRLFFVIGADAFAEIKTWFRWDEVARLVEFIVAGRPGHAYDAPPGVRFHRLEPLDLPVSSSEIRAALAAGQRPKEVPEAVLDYVYSHGLYGARVTA